MKPAFDSLDHLLQTQTKDMEASAIGERGSVTYLHRNIASTCGLMLLSQYRNM